jgi:hypothetical protein
MAKIEKLIGIYTGAALNTPATNVLRMPSITGTITGVYFDASEVTDGDLELAVYEDGVEVTTITVADTTANEDVTGLSFSSTLGKVISLDLLSPIPTAVPAPPWSLIVTVEVTETHVPLSGYTGTVDLGGASSLEIPNSATPTVNADGEIAVDTSVADFSHGIVKVYAGEELALVSLPIAELTTPTDGHVVAYNATNDEFELVAQSGSGVDTANSPNAGEWAKFTDADTIEGRTDAELKADLDLEIGTDIQAQDAFLQDIADLTDPGADRILFWDDSAGEVKWLEVSTNLSITDTAISASLSGGSVDTANSPNANEYARFVDADTIEGRTESEFKADMNLEIGVDVQAYDADLTTWAGITPGTNVGTQLALNANGTDDEAIGYRGIPQNSQSDNYTLALTDSGKHIYQTGASKTVTIPANTSIAFPVGSTVTFIATDAGGCTIAITDDTLRWAEDGSTGSVSLAQYGMATALKVTSTEWLISGVGLS